MAGSLTPSATLYNLSTGATVGTASKILSLSIKRDADGNESGHIELAFGTDIATAIAALRPGAASPLQLALCLAQRPDGSRPVDVRFMVETPVITLDPSSGGGGSTIVLTFTGLFRGYSLTAVDHLTTHGIPLATLIDGGAGTTSGGQVGYDMAHAPQGQAGIGNPAILAQLKGYGRTVPGSGAWSAQNRLQFQFLVDSSIANILVDSDEDGSPIDRAILSALAVATGIGNGGQALGVRAHFVADSSDSAAGNIVAGVDGTTYSGGCSIGKTPASTITFSDTPSAGQVQIIWPVVREEHLEDIEAQEAIEGGLSDHGLPPAATITGLVTVNDQASPTIDWSASLLIIACKTATGDGGAFFYHPETRTCWPCSPSLPVTFMWFDKDGGSGGTMYLATEKGIYRKPIFQQNAGPAPTVDGWDHIGGAKGLAGTCTKVLAETGTLPGAGSAGTYVTALCDATQEKVHGIFMHPQTDTSATAVLHGQAQGFDGWTCIDPTSDTVDYTYTVAHDELVTVQRRNPAAIWVRTQVTTTTAAAAGTYYTVANDSPILGLDKDLSRGTVIRTADGASGLYYFAAGGTSIIQLGHTGLVDPSGNPLMINRIVPYAGTIGGSSVTYLACTNRGISWTTDAAGTSMTWHGVGGQSGVADANILHVAAGWPQHLLDAASNKVASRVFCSTGSELYVSHSDSLFYRNELADPVDIGLWWLQLAQDAGLATPPSSFPQHDIVGFAWSGYTGPNTAGTATYVGTPGVVQTMAAGGDEPPAGCVWISPLQETWRRSYRLTNIQSDAPYFGTHGGEVSEIATSAGKALGAAAGMLAAVTTKRINENSKAQEILTLYSVINDPGSPLFALRPMQTVVVTINQPSYGFSLSAESFYVMDQQIEQRRGETVYRVTTTVAKILRDRPPTDQEIAASLGYRLKQMRRHIRIDRK